MSSPAEVRTAGDEGVKVEESRGASQIGEEVVEWEAFARPSRGGRLVTKEEHWSEPS